ncbi:MAG: tyrosine-type recombinase/integrase [Anaerolineae bacterium]|nr:tyrosine-type recombinase/integrase [Anaerolineae bacterium]
MYLDYALEGYWLSKRRNLSPNTQRDYELTFRRFLDFIGPNAEIENITSDDVERFLNFLTEELGLSDKTVINHFIALSSLWTWAERNLGVPHIIRGRVECPKYHRPQITPFTPEEVHALLEACDYKAPWNRRWAKGVRTRRPTALRDRAIILLLVDSGIRVSELVALRVRDYERRRGQVTIRHGKGNKTRVIFVGDTTRRAMWRYLTSRGELMENDPLFATSKGRPMDRHNVRKMLRMTGQRAGVKDVYPHRFRHTFAIAFLRNGGNPLELQEMLGHARLDTVRIYARLAEVDLERAQRNASPADNWRL